MRRNINNIVSVIWTLIRLLFLKMWYLSDLKFSIIERFSPNVVLEINRGAKVKFGNKVRIHSGSKLKVRTGGKLVIEENTMLNYNCIVTCHDEISIDKGTQFGPSVYIYDHDHDYRVGLSKEQYKTAPIHIGKNCWIGANSIILRGTELGDNCVVAAGTVVRGAFPANSLIYQKRENEIKEINYEG